MADRDQDRDQNQDQDRDQDQAVNWKAASNFFDQGVADVDDSDSDDADRAVLSDAGSDTDNDADDDKKVQLVEISIRGRRVQVTPAAAEAYREYMDRVRERDSRLGGEISRLREMIARRGGNNSSSSGNNSNGDLSNQDVRLPDPPDPALARTNWEAYHQQLLGYHNALISKTKLELQQQYQSERTRELEAERRAADNARWVRGFFDKYEELNDPHVRGIVQTVYNEHGAEIDSLSEVSTHDAYDRLAELTNERLMALTVRGKQAKDRHMDANANQSRRRPPKIEGGGSSSAGSEGPRQRQRFSVADWQQKKRALMRGDRRFDLQSQSQSQKG